MRKQKISPDLQKKVLDFYKNQKIKKINEIVKKFNLSISVIDRIILNNSINK